MNLQEVLKLLKIEEPSEFEYFENIADLVEGEEDIPEDVLFLLFSETNYDVVGELIGEYFEDIMEAMPDDSTDLYMLFENIKRILIGLIKQGSDHESLVHFVEEFSRFRTWYSQESIVECRGIDIDDIKQLSLRDAITLARVEQLERAEYHYDFDSCLEYRLEEYIMELADISHEEQWEDSEDMMESGYVYDDELRR